MNKYKMPRRYVSKRRVIRRKRYGKKRVPRNVMTQRGFNRPNTYTYKRTVFLQDQLSVSAGSNTAIAQTFSLDALPNYSDFTNLYDMYRINKVVFKIIPKITQDTLASGGGAQNANLNQIHSALDYDDATAPTSINQLCEYQSHKMTRGNLIHTRVVVPRVELTNASSTSMPKAYQWIDCDDASVKHRGIKVFIPGPNAVDTTCYYDVQMTYYISCKVVL